MTERPAELRSSAGLFFDIAMHDFRDFRLPCCHRIHSRIDDNVRSTIYHSDTHSGEDSWRNPRYSGHWDPVIYCVRTQPQAQQSQQKAFRRSQAEALRVLDRMTRNRWAHCGAPNDVSSQVISAPHFHSPFFSDISCKC